MTERKRRLEVDDDEEERPIVLTSSDDEEANRDLSLEIVERASRRGGAKVHVLEGSSGGVVRVVENVKSKRENKVKKKRAKGKIEEVSVEVEINDKETTTRKRRRRKRRKEEVDKVVDPAGHEEEPARAEGILDESPGSADSEVTDGNGGADSIILRKLLRGPRYFNADSCLWKQSCRNCGKEGHIAPNCTEEKRRKPCFVCGAFGHNPRRCLQAHDCFTCKRRGHGAKDCPDKHQRGFRNLTFCLRCGDLGHDMPSCKNTYLTEDLLEIQCFVCKEFGHLCCAEFRDAHPLEVSCYNCGQTGHSGVGCAMQRGKMNEDDPPLCYVCGEKGHFARGCTKNLKPSRQQVHATQQILCRKPKHAYTKATRSAPPLLRKPKQKPVQHDGNADGSGRYSSKKFDNVHKNNSHSGSSPPAIRSFKSSAQATDENRSGSSARAKLKHCKLSTPARNESHSKVHVLEKGYSDSFRPRKVRRPKLSSVATNGNLSGATSHLLLSARV